LFANKSPLPKSGGCGSKVGGSSDETEEENARLAKNSNCESENGQKNNIKQNTSERNAPSPRLNSGSFSVNHSFVPEGVHTFFTLPE
jgi:hypothetical protein